MKAPFLAKVPRLLLPLCIVGLASCGVPGEGSSGPNPNARLLADRADDPAERRDIFIRLGLRLAARTGVEVRTQLGEPASVSHRLVQNLSDPSVVDTVFTWGYDEVDVDVYLMADGRRLVSGVALSGDRFLTFPDIRMGTTDSAIRNLLGEPELIEGDLGEVGDDAMAYRCQGCPATSAPVLLIRLQEGAAVRIDFFFPVS